MWWDIWIMILAIWNSISIPFFVAFKPPEENSLYMLSLNCIIDIFFIADIVLNFCTTYLDPINGSEVLDHIKII